MVSRPKQTAQRGTTFAKGGAGKMFSKQTAGPQRPGVTAHAVKRGAAGAKSAKGGPPMRGTSSAAAAKAGHTSQIRKG